MSAAFSAVIALGIGYVISHVVDRARPFVHHRAFNLLHHSADAGFPSDHATAAFAIAAAIFIRSRRMGALALLIALLIAIGRVAEGAHYPSDVLGAAVLGCLVAIVLWLPPLRRVLDALADWAGKVYDRLAATVLRQPVRT